MKRIFLSLGLLGAAALAAAVFIGAPSGPSQAQGTAASQLSTAQKPRVMPQSRAEIQLSFAPVVRDVAPAVVNVYTRRKVSARARRHPFANDPFFRRFFGNDAFGMPRERVQSSLGSGVIVRGDGIVVTNNHVIEGGDEFTVVLNDRREFDAEVMLKDERTDLAVLKIEPKNETLPFVRFQDSDSLEVGDLVLAIGNPFGVGQTVTSGIVSALARTQVGVADYRFFIQTDAAINPGNSGGALVTIDGELIGINTAIFSRSGGSNGIGFAIPSNMVHLVVESALAGRRLVRPWLGAAYQTVSSEDAKALGLDRPGGALVTRVFPGGPADRAGIKPGDVIVRVENFDIADPQSLRYRVATQREGETVSIAAVREGRRRTAKVALRVPPEIPPRSETVLEGRNPLAGATVANLSPAFNEENGLDPLLTGVAILRMERNSPAMWARFQPGDILLAVNGLEVGTVDDVQRAVSVAQRAWQFEVRRGARTFTMSLRL